VPRRYTLGKRADAKEETRDRIIRAALKVYGERGFAGTSNLAIAREADVAPATVRNHFPGPRDLAHAAFDSVLGELKPPTPQIFDGVEGMEERVTRLAQELAAFYERSRDSWLLYRQEPDLIDAWSGGIERYYMDLENLMRLSLGPLAGDDTALAVVASVIGPPTFFSLQARGIPPDEVVNLVLELALPWLRARAG
jgi:AcrR family transcriptional regulator